MAKKEKNFEVVKKYYFRKEGIVETKGYDWIGEACFELYPVELDGKLGFADCNGEIVVPIIYDRQCHINDTVWAGNKQYLDLRKNKLYGLIKHDGTEVIAFQWEDMELSKLSEDLLPVSTEKKWGFVNVITGKTQVEPAYDKVEFFINGFAPVRIEDKWGMIDINGNVIIQPKYLLDSHFVGDFAIMFEGGSYECGRNTRLVSDRYVLLYGAAKEIVISKDRIENKPFFVIPLCSINEEHFIGGPYRRTIDKNGIYDYPSDYTNIYCFYSNRHTNWMDIESLGNLLKQNGVDLKGVMCLYNSIDYNDVNFLIKTESLPQKDAYLYKVYPGLKKYRGKKGKVAKIYLKGLKSSDELVSYFLPEGQKVKYGDGIEIELKDKKKVKINSLEEYFDSIAQEKNDSYEERKVKEENRLSADLFDFK